jgi:pimeloyl-ACP methyl ester carboxylesterase
MENASSCDSAAYDSTPGAFAKLSRGRMYYKFGGSGPGIVLLHGWPGFWFDYRHVLPSATTLGTVVAPDFFGFGDSDILVGAAVDVADEQAFAGDVVELLDWVGFDQAILVGHDKGSAVAPAVARLVPERVRGLVLLNPTHPYIGEKRNAPAAQREAWYQHFHLLPLAERLLDGHRDRVALYLQHFYVHWAGVRQIEPEELKQVIYVYARPGAFVASIAWYRARAAARTRDEKPQSIDLPTIALWGEGRHAPAQPPRGLRASLPANDQQNARRCGSLRPAEAPDAVVSAIGELLEATASTTGNYRSRKLHR